jgi:DNA-binding NarL/FixJ family response regulator
MKRFMLVEDNKRFREILKRFLTPYGTVVCESNNGTDAVIMYDSHHPDFVLMDIRMDGMDGITATRIIKHHHPDAQVIIVSECDESDFGMKVLQAGAIGFVAKGNLEMLSKYFPTGPKKNFDSRLSPATDRDEIVS